jgi:hypothetical protein
MKICSNKGDQMTMMTDVKETISIRFEVKREAHLVICQGKNKGSGCEPQVIGLSVPRIFVLKSHEKHLILHVHGRAKWYTLRLM